MKYLCTPEAVKLYPNLSNAEFQLQKKDLGDGKEITYHLPGGGIAESLYNKW